MNSEAGRAERPWSRHPLYMTWYAMKYRCYSERHNQFDDYGGRGIEVCDHWLDPEVGFHNFLDDMGEKPGPEYTLHRVDGDGDYEPDNCVWAPDWVQKRDKRASKILSKDVPDVLEMIRAGMLYREIAAKYDCDEHTISHIARQHGISRSQVARTHCPHGHPYSGDNLYTRSNGKRVCRECGKERARTRRARLKEAA